MTEYPSWPGPREAAEGEIYDRNEPNGEGDVYVVDQIETVDTGRVIVTGRYE